MPHTVLDADPCPLLFILLDPVEGLPAGHGVQVCSVRGLAELGSARLIAGLVSPPSSLPTLPPTMLHEVLDAGPCPLSFSLLDPVEAVLVQLGVQVCSAGVQRRRAAT
jgi:hypothetical protein